MSASVIHTEVEQLRRPVLSSLLCTWPWRKASHHDMPWRKASHHDIQRLLQPEHMHLMLLVQRVLSCLQVYSFGVTLWEILERKRLFEGMEASQVRM